MIQLHFILLEKIDVHYIQVNLYTYKQVTLYRVDQPYQNDWSSVSELIDGSLTVVSDFSLTKSLKTLIISMLLSFFIVKFVKINVLIWANVCYNRHRR